MSAGDLSLSQSLGGLRIANPDDEDALQSPDSASPAALSSDPLASAGQPPPSLSSSNSVATPVTQPPLNAGPQFPRDEEADRGGALGWHPENYNSREEHGMGNGFSEYTFARADTGSMHSQRAGSQGYPPSITQSHQNLQYAPPASHSQQLRAAGVQHAAVRPLSGIYYHPNASSGSGISNQGSYNYRQDLDMSDGPVGKGLMRRTSRGARQVLAEVPSRESSRSHRSTSQPLNGGNGSIPPRGDPRWDRSPNIAALQSQGYVPQDPGYPASASISRPREEYPESGTATPPKATLDHNIGQMTNRVVKKGVKDFNFGRTLGEGSYSTVLAATDRQTLKEYAIKVLDKRHIIKEKKVKYVNIERDTLNRLTDHPGIVRLYYTFQDERSLYFVLDLASGGELLGVLKKLRSFDVECTRFYGAEILDSVAYMHSRGVIHRDLKPENVLLDSAMHVKITDFGTAKILGSEPKAMDMDEPGNPMDGAETDRAVSFVGTAEYVSPELLRDKNACKASDLWAFGCIIYQLLAGRPPFKAANEYLTFQKILALDYSFPEEFPDVARDLVERLLVLEPANRLSIDNVRAHPFFEGVQWGKSLWRQKVPRLKPYAPPTKDMAKPNGQPKQPGSIYTTPMGANMTAPHPQAAQAAAAALNQHVQRPPLRGVTELPPPSQLDIDWSPVLTHNNERILKLGNLLVASCPQPHSPISRSESGPVEQKEKPKFSRFFSSSHHTSKKRERLVLITSAARVVIAAAGGNEKKAKMDIRLLADGCSWKDFMDSRGLVGWQVDTRDKQITFEDPRATTADPAGSKFSTQEWLDSVENSCELARLQQSLQSSRSYSTSMNELGSTMSSPADSVGADGLGEMPGGHHLKHTLRRGTTDDDTNPSSRSRKRFSKRHSKSGLAAVF